MPRKIRIIFADFSEPSDRFTIRSVNKRWHRPHRPSYSTAVVGTAEAAPNARPRLDFVDVVRGFAVVFMILWHSADSWIRDDVRASTAFATLRFLGGLAAPTFLLLAGVSLGLKNATEYERGTNSASTIRANVGRGMEVWVLGYFLRLQMWGIDSGGFLRLHGLRIWPFIAFGLGLLIWASRRLGKEPARAVKAMLVAAPLFAFGLWQASILEPTRLIGLVRVDVLQAIGASLVIVSMIGPWLGPRTSVSILAGVIVAFLTPLVAKMVPGPLPHPIAAYLAQWPPPPGGRIVALFPLFPWLTYVFVGRGIGMSWHRDAAQHTLTKSIVWQAGVGLVLAILFNESLAYSAGYLTQLPWLTAPVRIISRVAIGLVLSGLSLSVTFRAEKSIAWLKTIGTASMLIYFVHMEFAYGIAAYALKRKLSVGAWFVGFVILTLAMIAAVKFRRGPLERMSERAKKFFENSTSA